MMHLVGAGGHGTVVLDALLASGWSSSNIVVMDQNPERVGKLLLGIVVGYPELKAFPGQAFHISVGCAASRQRLVEEALLAGGELTTIVHPKAQVSTFARRAEGCFVAALATVGPAACLGRSVIVNHGAVVDHDCSVGSFSHIAPNGCLGGGVSIGERCMIGASATILPGVQIGDDVTIGAGAVVTRDVPANQTWAGIPAAPLAGSR